MSVPPVGGDGRFLELVEACNVRDLGGLPAADGRHVRPGRLLRGDLPIRLAPADEDALIGRFGLRTVVDLRSPGEVERFPGPWPAGVEVVSTPFPLDPAFTVEDPADLVERYLQFLEPPAAGPDGRPADQVLRALRVAIEADRHPLLVHCAAGKDRTGALVAILLDLVGVDRAAIVADYALTAGRIATVRERYEAELGRSFRDLPEALFSAVPETMEAFLAALEERYGGARSWALRRGVPAVDVDRFAAAMLA